MKLQTFYQVLLVTGCTLLFSCQKDFSSKKETELTAANASGKTNQDQKYNTFYGHQVQIGDGRVRTFVTVSHTDIPQEIGLEMTPGALKGLPSEAVNLSLPFHKKASEVTPFNHMLFDWNPHGHEPFFYEVPHYDFHFYMISDAERRAISASSPLMDQLPPQQFWPQGFVPTPGGVPQMGKHWVNPTSPEITGERAFTHTMIYGSYAGKIIFVEPMVTQAFIKSGERVNMPYGQPNQFMLTNTYYPTKYNVYAIDGKHYITLSDFVRR